jgi:hypothetical protein
VSNGLFLTFHQKNRPLSLALRQRFLRPLMDAVQRCGEEEMAAPTVDIVAALIAPVRVEPPRLGGQRRAEPTEGEWRPAAEAGTRLPTLRYRVAVEVDGDAALLETWPDAHDGHLVPVDAGLGEWWTPARHAPGQYDHAEQMRRHEALLSQDRYTLGRDDASQALYVFVDLTEQDRLDVRDGLRDPKQELDDAIARVRPIVEAIAQQTAAFFDNELPKTLAEHVDRQRERLGAHRAVLDSLSWPDGWKYPPPVVEPAADAGGPGQSAADTLPPTAKDELALGRPSRMADASFADVLRTIRVWADAVERHPRAYRDLDEDPISDLLAATLNAALPGAQREVFTRKGKSDILVRGDVMSIGAAPAAVFVCECKKWHGKEKANQALDQLFGYVGVNDVGAVLLFYVPLANPAKARDEALAILTSRDDFAGQITSVVDGWALLRYVRDGRDVTVCVAFVDLPDLDKIPRDDPAG